MPGVRAPAAVGARRLRPDRSGRQIAAAFGGGLAMGFGILVLQDLGLFFALILGWLIGIAMGELVLWASGRWRGPETALDRARRVRVDLRVPLRPLLRDRPR